MKIPDSLQEIIVGYFEGTLTQEQSAELLAWVRQDDEHLQYFRQLYEIWHVTENTFENDNRKERTWRMTDMRIRERGLRHIPKKELRLSVAMLWKAAAALLVFLGLSITGWLFFGNNSTDPVSLAYVETKAPNGSRSLITLPDNTTVWLNAGTTFRYPVDYGKTSRNVFLNGEAYFRVSKNKKLPFVVNTTDIAVTALGTAFNVKAYDDENTIETTLEEGKVRIDATGEGPGKELFHPVFLKPQQNAVFQKRTGEMALTNTVASDSLSGAGQQPRMEIIPITVSNVADTRVYTSWKDARWIFKNERLGTLVPKLERRYDVSVVFVDKELEDYAFSGILLEESLEQVLAAIQLAAPVRFEIHGKQVQLFANRKLLDYYNKQHND